MVDITIRQIEAGDTVTGLSLGDADFQPLKTYLQRDAKKHHEQSLARTYVVLVDDEDPKKIQAYITLLCGEVVIDPHDGGLVDGDGLVYPYKQYPAVKIARLAVDHRLKAKNLKVGTQLVDLAIGIVKEYIQPHVGCRFIMLDAKKKSVGFYEKYGFTALDTDTNRARDLPVMFIDLYKLDA